MGDTDDRLVSFKMLVPIQFCHICDGGEGRRVSGTRADGAVVNMPGCLRDICSSFVVELHFPSCSPEGKDARLESLSFSAELENNRSG